MFVLTHSLPTPHGVRFAAAWLNEPSPDAIIEALGFPKSMITDVAKGMARLLLSTGFCETPDSGYADAVKGGCWYLTGCEGAKHIGLAVTGDDPRPGLHLVATLKA